MRCRVPLLLSSAGGGLFRDSTTAREQWHTPKLRCAHALWRDDRHRIRLAAPGVGTAPQAIQLLPLVTVAAEGAVRVDKQRCRAGDSPAITMSCRLRMMFVAIRMGKAGPSTCPTPLLARFGRHRSGLYRPRGHLPSQSNLGLAATTDQGNARPDLLNPALQSRITLFS